MLKQANGLPVRNDALVTELEKRFSGYRDALTMYIDTLGSDVNVRAAAFVAFEDAEEQLTHVLEGIVETVTHNAQV